MDKISASAFDCSSPCGAVDWPTPAPLEGVKSRNRIIVEVVSGKIQVANTEIPNSRLAVNLNSRISVIGAACRVADALLSPDCNSTPEQVSRHSDLTVLRIGPQDLPAQDGDNLNHYLAIRAKICEHRPHVLVLHEASELGNIRWNETFSQLIGSNVLRTFCGAVVICAAKQTRLISKMCQEEWALVGGCLRQQACLQVVYNVLDNDIDAEWLSTAVSSIEYCDLSYWINRARSNNWSISLFTAGGQAHGYGDLRGLVFHHMIDSRAEFHVRFIFVPKAHRCCGLGGRLVRWVIDSAAQKSQDECRWISLDAAEDDLVEWYEKFGFTDMSCGHSGDDYGQTWMEMRNVSVCTGEECSMPCSTDSS